MAEQKLDGLIESVRYGTDGNVTSVRIYERRGPTFSDRKIIDREELVNRIKKGLIFAAGERLANLGSTFKVSQSIYLVGERGKEKLATSRISAAEHDRLDGVPIF